MHTIEAFFLDVDAELNPSPSNHKIRLNLIGSTALFLQCDYLRGTKDSDVLETLAITGATRKALEQCAGKGSRLHKKYRFYLDIVATVIPFLPLQPTWYPAESLNLRLHKTEIFTLDPVEVVVSKLARFHANDRDDIREMVRREMVSHKEILKCLQSAFQAWSLDARIEDAPRIIENFQRVERDYFGLEASEIKILSGIKPL